MSTDIKWRDDQLIFIVAAMDYIIARAEERLDGSAVLPFEKFTATRVKVSAIEIRGKIMEAVGGS